VQICPHSSRVIVPDVFFFYCFYVLCRIFLPYYCSNGHLSVQEFLPWCFRYMSEINWNWSIGKQSGKSVEYIVTKESRNIRLWVVCGAGSMKRYGECPSVCLVCLLQQRAAGLLLWALLARNIDRLLQPRRAVAGSAALSAFVSSCTQASFSNKHS